MFFVSSLGFFDYAEASHKKGIPCSISVSVSTTSVTYNGTARNNPDKTFYPGDAFHYIFKYSGSPTCRNFKVHPVQTSSGISIGGHPLEDGSGASLFDGVIASKCKTSNAKSGCISGHAEIGMTSFTNESTSLTVSGQKKVCSKEKCRWVTVSRTATYGPQIISPQITATITKEILKDSDGYDAMNLDGTYYVWDPINILHRPEFLWQNERAETLHTKVIKKFDVHLEQEFDCIDSTCMYTLEHPGLTPSDWQMDHTHGLTLYNATSYNDVRLQNFEYVIDLLNIDRFLASVTNSTDALVVQYGPKYDSYPYPVLIDEAKHAFNDRMGVAMHYFGSKGGGTDDIDGIHEDRRSKINGFHHFGVAFDPWLPINLNNNTLHWSQALDVGIIQNNSTVQKMPGLGKIIPSDDSHKDRIPFVTAENTAMFEKAGYGKIYFEYEDIAETVYDYDRLVPRYENVTSFTTLKSTGFAGADTTYLTFAEYLYPEIFFNTKFVVQTISDQSMPVSIKVKPQLDAGATYFADYVNEKVNYDSGDDGLAKIVVSDIHVMPELFYSDDGFLDITIKRMSSLFDTFGFSQSSEGTSDAGTIEQLYLESTNKQRLDADLSVGMSAPSSMDIAISANEITHTIDGKYFDFSQNHNHTINILQNNTLDASRNNGSITINTNDSFGDIVKIQINDDVQEISCVSTCSITVDKHDALDVRAWNIWGGMSVVLLPEMSEMATAKPSPPDDFLMAYILVVVPLGYIAYRKLKART